MATTFLQQCIIAAPDFSLPLQYSILFLGLAFTILSSDFHLHQSCFPIYLTFHSGVWLLHKRVLGILLLCGEGNEWDPFRNPGTANEQEETGKPSADPQLLVFLFVLGTSEYSQCSCQHQQHFSGNFANYKNHQ